MSATSEIRTFPASSIEIKSEDGVIFDDPQGAELYEGTILKSDKPDEVNKSITIQVFGKVRGPADQKLIDRQKDVFCLLKHPVIPHIIGQIPAPCKPGEFEGPGFVLEHINFGSLEALMTNEDIDFTSVLTPTNTMLILYGIARALGYMHTKNLMHRNLCRQVVYLHMSPDGKYLKPVLGGFGLSRTVDLRVSTINAPGATDMYKAPEILMGSSSYGFPVDVYSYGILMHQIFSADFEFPSGINIDYDNYQQISRQLIAGHRFVKPENMPENFYKYACRCWDQNAIFRPNFDDICTFLEDQKNWIPGTEAAVFNEFKATIDKAEAILPPPTQETDFTDTSKLKVIKVEINRSVPEIKFDEITESSDEEINFSDQSGLSEFSLGKYNNKGKERDVFLQKYAQGVDKVKTKEFERSLLVLSSLKFPSLLHVIGMVPGTDERGPIVVMPPMVDNLRNSLDQAFDGDFDFTPTLKMICIYGVAKALWYLHSQGMIHRNLSPDVVYLDCKTEDDTFMVYPFLGGLEKTRSTDFRMSVITKDDDSIYEAPELSSSFYGNSVDVYSFGILLHQMFTNEKEFSSSNIFGKTSIAARLKDGDRFSKPEDMPDKLYQLATQCWDQEPSNRPDFNTICKNLTLPEYWIEETDAKQFRTYMSSLNYAPVFKNISPAVLQAAQRNALPFGAPKNFGQFGL